MKRLPLLNDISLSRGTRHHGVYLSTILFLFVLTFASTYLKHSALASSGSTTSARLLERCKSISTPAGPLPGFQSSSRVEKGSDRQVPGTPPTLIRNAKIWTGTHNGTKVVEGDILLDKGVIISVGKVPSRTLEAVKKRHGKLEIVDVEGRWVTPGLVDLHSHIGLSSAPILRGSSETNSHKAPILPWLRSVDGLNTHDLAYELSIAGGVTTVQVLPGSGNNIGGQAFLIKLRQTAERSVISKVLEPPQMLIGNQTTGHHNWRHMKHACGENPDRVYSQTRMDAAWNFRQAYEEARKIRDAQDAFCARVEASSKGWHWPFGSRKIDGEFPESLQWESLVDVLRGRVKLSIHCYEAVDLDVIVRLSNEFKFPVASFHHAGETYLVPELLKKTWGGAPTIALFASNARKKREAYRGSEFAPRVLASNGIPVVMKSDHPVLNSRYLLYEAQQAHYYGLDPALALLSVTSTPAKAAGVGHRVGTIDQGFDADIAVWDSHPLTLGATPTQVYIDGVAQLTSPHTLAKPSQFQDTPQTPNWDREAQKAVDFEGLPPLRGRRIHWGGRRPGQDVSETKDGVKFLNVRSAWVLDDEGNVQTLFDIADDNDHVAGKTIIIRDGHIACVAGKNDLVQCAQSNQEDFEVIDLQGGSLAPGLTTFGSPIGLVEIRLEPSTTDGVVFDPLIGGVPTIVGGDEAIIRAVDGLQFEGRNTLLAYRGGVTRAITPPLANGFLSGLSTTLDVGATSAAEEGAVVQEETALHVTLSLRLGVSVSTQVATLRRLLFDSTSPTWNRVREGEIPLAINVDSADIMATLLRLKSNYEASSGKAIRMTFVGAAEAHLLATQIGNANISVVITSPRPYPGYWENQRIIPGPPLTHHTAITTLLAANVNVAIGVMDEFNARNARFDIAWVALEANGTISRAQAIGLATTRLHRALGSTYGTDLVAYRGGSLFDLHAKVAGVISLKRRTIELF